MKHPIQHTVIDHQGTLRFVKNDVVNLLVKLLEKRGVDLNEIVMLGQSQGISSEDWDQFHQLTGYSVSGAPISEKIKDIVYEKIETPKTEMEIRAERAEKLLKRVRESLAEGVAELYNSDKETILENVVNE